MVSVVWLCHEELLVHSYKGLEKKEGKAVFQESSIELYIQTGHGQCERRLLVFEADKTRPAPRVKLEKLHYALFQSPSNFQSLDEYKVH